LLDFFRLHLVAHFLVQRKELFGRSPPFLGKMFLERKITNPA
jgi:hypothetical protein